MSCRVIGRTVESTLLSAIVAAARDRGCRSIRGTYVRTSKNGMVADLYTSFGFARVPGPDDQRIDYLLWLDAWTEPRSFIAVPVAAARAREVADVD
jgi:hypothetical protein